jgi:hypothetical protein
MGIRYGEQFAGDSIHRHQLDLNKNYLPFLKPAAKNAKVANLPVFDTWRRAWRTLAQHFTSGQSLVPQGTWSAHRPVFGTFSESG